MLETQVEINAQRVAQLTAHGCSDSQIIDALCLTEAELIELRATEIYKKSYSEKVLEKADYEDTVNSGWDGLEAQALEVLVSNLGWSRDPQFALNVARTANQATRRKAQGRDVIDGRTDNGRVVINLNATFVKQLGNNVQVNVGDKPTPEKKISAVPNPKRVQEMLIPVADTKPIEDKGDKQNMMNVLLSMEKELQSA